MQKLTTLGRYSFIMLSVLKLMGCAFIDQAVSVHHMPKKAFGEEDTLEKFIAQQKDDIAGGVLPNGVLTSRLLYRILESDIAAQRGEADRSAVQWLALAKKMCDARAAKHAALIALYAKDFIRAEEAANLWVNLAPCSQGARRLLIAVLLERKKFSFIIPHVKVLLRSQPEEAPQFFNQMHVLWGQQFNLAEVVSTSMALTQDYLHLPEAKVALAYAKQISGQHAEANQLLNAALRQNPQLKSAKDLLQAIAMNPDLVIPVNHLASDHSNSYPESQTSKNLLTAPINDIDKLYEYGLRAEQQAQWDQAIAQLTQVEKSHPSYVNEVRLDLARIAEKIGDFDEAQRWYKRVTGHLKNQAQYAFILSLAKAHNISAALKQLIQIPRNTPQDKIQYIQLHAQIYAINKIWRHALAILSNGLQSFPHSADLYYDRAWILMHSGKLKHAEADLRHALALAPDNPMVQNGLGFILVERATQLHEAQMLIARARKRAPQNPYIEDSWAWLLYRQGKIFEAEKVLQRVFLRYKDPEIINHLVEILWVQKKYEQAKSILNSGLKAYPNHEKLLDISERLKIK